MPGKRPSWRFLMKDPDSSKLVELGAAWETSKKDIFSVSLDLENTGERINFMMVKNGPRQEAAPIEQQQDTGNAKRNNPRRKAADQQPAA